MRTYETEARARVTSLLLKLEKEEYLDCTTEYAVEAICDLFDSLRSIQVTQDGETVSRGESPKNVAGGAELPAQAAQAPGNDSAHSSKVECAHVDCAEQCTLDLPITKDPFAGASSFDEVEDNIRMQVVEERAASQSPFPGGGKDMPHQPPPNSQAQTDTGLTEAAREYATRFQDEFVGTWKNTEWCHHFDGFRAGASWERARQAPTAELVSKPGYSDDDTNSPNALTAPAAEQPPKDWKEWLELAEIDIKRWQDLARGKLPGLLSEWMNRDQGVPEDPEVERLLGIILKHWNGKPLRCDHCETEVTRPDRSKDGR